MLLPTAELRRSARPLLWIPAPSPVDWLNPTSVLVRVSVEVGPLQIPAPLGAVFWEMALRERYAVPRLVRPPPQPIDEALALTTVSTSDKVPSFSTPAPPSVTFPFVIRKPLNVARPSLLILTTRPVR